MSGDSKGAGVTKSIREFLNFTDNARWKEFSNRRLELIDKFNLSSKKASEQDNDIKSIAIILRDEFGYPVDTTNEFDKLVRAAVQSVRRNRKRSSRARINHNRFIIVEENNPVQIPIQLPVQLPVPLPPLTPPVQAATAPIAEEISLPSINSVLTNTENEYLPNSAPKKKLLKQIQNSKTCLLLSNNSTDINEDNLLNLGKSIVSASISFVLERFFQDISNSSIKYLFEKLNDDLTLSKILKSLSLNSIEVLNLNNKQATNLFFKLIGCCVKDFGFDINCYNLCEIFHEIILNDYPLISTQIKKISKESLIMPLLSMKPIDTNKEIFKTVKIKYNNKFLEFKFYPISNSPPTFLELISNCKIAFNIKKTNSFRLKFNNFDIFDDFELEKIFKDLDLNYLEFELYEVGNFTKLL